MHIQILDENDLIYFTKNCYDAQWGKTHQKLTKIAFIELSYLIVLLYIYR